MNFDTTDPWADETPKKEKVLNHENTFNKLDSISNTINIFGDSTSSSMVDSFMGDSDSLSYNRDNNWGKYNSSNILSQTNKDKILHFGVKPTSQSSNDNTVIDNIPKTTIHNDELNIFKTDENENSNIINYNKNKDNESDEFENDENEEDLIRPVDIQIWSDSEIKSFNPLSLKNSADGLIMQVREIPEKEGLVFKHTNYLISHTLKFNNEHFDSVGNNGKLSKQKLKNSNDNETKVIRRYSDFAWLVEALWKKYPFRLIPELPPKKFSLASSNDVLFLQKRRRGLQRFLYQLCKHPVLSKENLVVMFLTVPNDFSTWRKFANIELNDEFDGIRINLPKRFKLDLSDVLKGLRDNDSNYEDNIENINDDGEDSIGNNKNEFVINNVNQIWNESPTKFKNKDFISNITQLNDNLSRLAEFWSKLYLLVERIEKRELSLALDHQRFAIFLDGMTKIDEEVFSMDNLIENKGRKTDDETQNISIINSVLKQVSNFFVTSRKLKEEEALYNNNEILERWKSFHDYLISLHFLIERFTNYKVESEKEIQILLQKIIKTNEKIKQLKMKSDIKGSEIEKYINILIESVDQLSMLISKIILIKTTFVNEFKLFQKVKYLISEVFQNWFEQRGKYSEIYNNNIQRILNELKDMPLGN